MILLVPALEFMILCMNAITKEKMDIDCIMSDVPYVDGKPIWLKAMPKECLNVDIGQC